MSDARRYRRAPHVKTRAVPDLRTLVAFSSAAPRLQWLNLTAWAIFELCPGLTHAEAITTCERRLGGRIDAAAIEQTILDLERNGLVERA